MVYDAFFVIAEARMQNWCREATLRALLAEAGPAVTARSRFAISVGHLFVWIGERIEGVRYVPTATLSSGQSSR
jgi:hypothetical protein